MITDLRSKFASLPRGTTAEGPDAAMLLPLATPEQDLPYGVLILGLAPDHALEESYAIFCELAAAQIVTAIRNSQSHKVERRRADLELERKRLESFVTKAPSAIAVMRGENLIYEIANEQYLQLVGKVDIIGKPAREILPELNWDNLESVFRTGEPFRAVESRGLFARGESEQLEECFFNWVGEPTHGPKGKIDGVVIFAIEVTEQVVARQHLEAARGTEMMLRQVAESASRAKDDFMAMLGHELRNPLAPILTALDLMRLRGMGNERERDVIERQVNHLVRLVDDMLDISRITSGKVELKKERVELAEIVAKAIELASPLIEQRRHHLSVNVPALGLVVRVDPARLAQVISNLLTNSAKYSDRGCQISLLGERVDDQVVLHVRDTGIGIAPAVLPTIFDLFTQERQSLDRSRGGLGLGLAIVRSLVRAHGGEVEARSEGAGHGSEFIVRLPALETHVRAGATTTMNVVRSLVATHPRRVLVVDDNEDAAEMLGDSLEAIGHIIRVAHDGAAALRLVEEFVPEVALLDIGLPAMDGYELAKRLQDHPELKQLRLVAITGYGQDSDRTQSKAAGFAAHMVKPINVDRVHALIEELMSS